MFKNDVNNLAKIGTPPPLWRAGIRERTWCPSICRWAQTGTYWLSRFEQLLESVVWLGRRVDELRQYVPVSIRDRPTGLRL